MSVKMRQEVERKIATALVKSAIDAGYAISVHNGEDETRAFLLGANVISKMFTTDEDHLYFHKGGVPVGWVYFVYGNDGWDVISDYSINLEPIMTAAKKIADYYAG